MNNKIPLLVEKAIKELKNADVKSEVRKILTSLAEEVNEIGLKPLPDKMPELIRNLLNKFHKNELLPSSFYESLRQHFGVPIPEWWEELKEGDKFIYNGIENDRTEKKTFNGRYSCFNGRFYLYTKENGHGAGIDVFRCSPYPKIEYKLRETLDNEQNDMLDDLLREFKIK